MEICNKCKEPLVYKEVLRKDGKLKIKAVCKKKHEKKFEEKIQRNRPWI